MLKWSHYPDSAWHPVRWALAQFASSSSRSGIESSSRGQETDAKEMDSVAGLEKLVYVGNLKDSRSQICQRMTAGQTVVLEGFALETVAALCDQHNYRWSFCDQPKGKAHLSFVVRPGANLSKHKSTLAAKAF